MRVDNVVANAMRMATSTPEVSGTFLLQQVGNLKEVAKTIFPRRALVTGGKGAGASVLPTKYATYTK